MIDVLNHKPNILLENFLEDYQKFNKIDYKYAKQLQLQLLHQPLTI